ncbi:unnamed protein product [Moneuplotes crassus]|uniref:Uncharacterized protein n=1 Tax=Euplotes crassus TaxID=5936 RepID=A0AAD1XSQ5_EUPCR|nr:unnamed protein product [Moneuplotes crassus]
MKGSFQSSTKSCFLEFYYKEILASFREIQYRYSASKLEECLQSQYFRCLIHHYLFETYWQTENSN